MVTRRSAVLDCEFGATHRLDLVGMHAQSEPVRLRRRQDPRALFAIEHSGLALASLEFG